MSDYQQLLKIKLSVMNLKKMGMYDVCGSLWLMHKSNLPLVHGVAVSAMQNYRQGLKQLLTTWKDEKAFYGFYSCNTMNDVCKALEAVGGIYSSVALMMDDIERVILSLVRDLNLDDMMAEIAVTESKLKTVAVCELIMAYIDARRVGMSEKAMVEILTEIQNIAGDEKTQTNK